MPDLTTTVLLVYGLGLALGLARTDASWPTRVALSLLWPLGPLAFIIVIAVLYIALPVAFPVLGSIVFTIGIAVALILASG